MTDKFEISRRLALRMIFGAATLLAFPLAASASDNEPDSHDNNDSSDSRDDSEDSDEDENDSGSDDSSNQGTVSQNNSGTSSGQQTTVSHQKTNRGKVLNQEEVQVAIATQNAASLTLLLTYVDLTYSGSVLDVKLRKSSDGYIYEVKMLSKFAFLRTVLLNAKTLKKIDM